MCYHKITDQKINYWRWHNAISRPERDEHVEFYDNFKFDWHENKHRDNVKKHKVSFYQAITVFSSSPLLTESDDLHSQDEQRYKTTGYSVKNRLLVVIYIDRGDVTRIISARKVYCLRFFRPLPYHSHIWGIQYNEPKDLKALCLGCHAEQSGQHHHMMRETEDYKHFMEKYGKRWRMLRCE